MFFVSTSSLLIAYAYIMAHLRSIAGKWYRLALQKQDTTMMKSEAKQSFDTDTGIFNFKMDK